MSDLANETDDQVIARCGNLFGEMAAAAGVEIARRLRLQAEQIATLTAERDAHQAASFSKWEEAERFKARVAELEAENAEERKNAENLTVLANSHYGRAARLESALREIESADQVDMALDPEWPARIARAALACVQEGEDSV